MLATETTQIVTRLNLSGLLPVRDPAMVAVWPLPPNTGV